MRSARVGAGRGPDGSIEELGYEGWAGRLISGLASGSSVQRHGDTMQPGKATQSVQAAAAYGTSEQGSVLPHLDKIQAAFGPHDVTQVQAHVGGKAAAASASMGAEAYATGNHVAFAGSPDLHTAAHEAAHVVQQRAGVQLKGGVGEVDDWYEQNADAVADKVVAGDSAASLLGPTGEVGSGGTVQRKSTDKPASSLADEAITRLGRAESQLDALIGLCEGIQFQVNRKDIADESLPAIVSPVNGAEQGVAQSLQLAVNALRRHVGNERRGGESVAVSKAGLLAHPDMQGLAQRLTAKVGEYRSMMDGMATQRPKIAHVFKRGGGGLLVGRMYNVRANLNLKRMTYRDFKSAVEVPIVVDTVRLGTGAPHDEITIWVNAMSDAWQTRMHHFSLAAEEIIGVVERAQFEQADGFVDLMIEHGGGLLTRGTEFLTGSAFAATVFIKFASKLKEHQDSLELARKQGDQDSFVATLKQQVNELQAEGRSKATSQIDLVKKLDVEFVDIGRRASEDQWKDNDRVVFGGQAKFLKELEAKARSYVSASPLQSDFASTFLADWINAHSQKVSRGGWRSPFDSPTYQDGYIDIPMELYTAPGRLGVRPGTPTLHCPKASEIAKSLQLNIKSFDLSKVPCERRLTIDPGTAGPPGWTEPDHIRIGQELQLIRPSSAGRLNWVLDQTKLSLPELLRKFKTLEG